MTDWSRKLQGDNGARDLQKARDLDRDDFRAWLKAHHANSDPAVSFDPDVSPVVLFENVWEMNPVDELRTRFTEAVLLEYQANSPTAESQADYLGFLIRLMIYLPLTDFPEKSIWKLFRSSLSNKLSTDDGVPLRMLAIQAIFARGKMSLDEKEGLLKRRDTVNLAYKALCDTGLGQAILHLPDLLNTLDAQTDDVFIITHLRILIEQYGEKELMTGIENSGLLQTSIHSGRIGRLLAKLGITFEKLRVIRTRMKPKDDTMEKLDKIVLRAFDMPSLPKYQQWMSKTAPYNGASHAANPWG